MGGPGLAVRRQADAREHFLLIVQGEQAGQRLPFGRTPLVLGRRTGCDVVLADAEISGRHCEVVAKGYQGDALVTDLGSTNGTFVDGKRVQGSARLTNGAMLRLGGTLIKHEYRLASEIAQSQEMDRDLEKANHYVQSLLPEPISQGPVCTDWHFQPSAKLGGDAFGYQWLDAHRFVAYLVDVSGHGAGAAMHSVSVMNVLRQRALPQTDCGDPAAVLASLNTMFQMDSHDGMYFSIWYGAYDTRTRTLAYASAGHHPAFLAQPGAQELQALQTRNLVIGAAPSPRFVAGQVPVAPGSQLHVFSDGVFEITSDQGRQWGLADFLPLLRGAGAPDGQQGRRLHQAVTAAARPGPLEDDFSMLTVLFN
jgi:serine phosphatase RsbU (regulator of sigma subunit)